MHQQSYKDKVVVITGGSSGIGLALAKEFAGNGARLALIARDPKKLERAKSEIENLYAASVGIYVTDVSDWQKINMTISAIGEHYNGIDVLINCAGIITCGKFADQSIEMLEQCMRINYLGSVYTTKAAWPFLKASRGQISFVSSVAGYMGLFGYSSYSPGKFAMVGLAECLRMEGKDDGIHVSIIYPPDTDTALLSYEHANTLPECRALSKNIKVKSAGFVARKYLAGLQQRKFSIYCDADSRMLRWFKNNFPSLFNYLTSRVIQKARKV